MLVIRLTRRGKKNHPFFRIIVIDKRKPPKGGRPVEILGYVDPLTKRKNLKKDRIQYWLSKGAKPSATVHNLLVQEKIIEAKKIHISRIHPVKSAPRSGAVSRETGQFNGVKKSNEAAKIATAVKTSAPAQAPAKEEKPAETPDNVKSRP